MFFAHCPTYDTTVMLSMSSLVELRNTPAGPEVVLRCHCGQHLTALSLHDREPVAA